MCKILALTNVTKIKSISSLANKASIDLGARERDGFGYSALGTMGVFGERTTSPLTFESGFKRPVLNVPFAESTYNRFGTKSTLVGPALFHGRTSTNHKTLVNTHPINKHGWSLIHNGVVTNHGPDYSMDTTNDTEHLVQYLGTVGISGIESHLTGYYAIAAIDPKGQLHIVKDSTASLFVTKIESIDSLLFGTSEDLIQDFCKANKWAYSTINRVQDNVHLIFNVNNLVSHSSIKPRGRTSVENKHASASLGRELSTDWNSKWDTGYTSESTAIPGLSLDEESFLAEMELHADKTYIIRDYSEVMISLESFRAMSTEDKLCCTAIRSDGTVADPSNYFEDKIYNGKVG